MAKKAKKAKKEETPTFVLNITPKVSPTELKLYLSDDGGNIDVMGTDAEGINWFLIGFNRDGTIHRYGGINIPGIETDEGGHLRVVKE